MKKHTNEDKRVAKIEVDLLEISKGIDKFDYDIMSKAQLVIIAGLLTLLIIGVQEVILRDYWVLFLTSVLLILVSTLIFWLVTRPFKKRFMDKYELVKDRYEILGANVKGIERELGNHHNLVVKSDNSDSLLKIVAEAAILVSGFVVAYYIATFREPSAFDFLIAVIVFFAAIIFNPSARNPRL